MDFMLKNSYLSTENQSKPIKNIATGMEIEIRQSGIRETFGNPKYYDKLSFKMKKAKISTIEHLAKMIKYGVVRSQEAPNYHNKNSKVTYAYLKHPINIDEKNYLVNIDIRKSPKGENRFYIHSLELKKETDLSSPQSELLMDKSISYDNNIPRINNYVKSGISTNNMQNINIDTIKQKEKHNNIDTDIIENLD